MLTQILNSSATFSDDLKYRYLLTRTWDKNKKSVLFIMLNPSTADAFKFDPTVKRCFDFAHAWGYGEMAVCNLFAFRSTDPKKLMKEKDPVGVDNNRIIQNASLWADRVVAAWGTHGQYLNRGDQVIKQLTESLCISVYCLETTKDGYPCHPLYQKSDLRPKLFRDAVECNEDESDES